MEVRKYNFGENDFPAKICLGEVPIFLPLVNAKNQLQNFEEHLKQKRCAIRC